MTRRRKRDYASTLPRPLPAEVARTSLLERVKRADDANLVVVVAPSGYGKTTFLGQLARASRHPAWLTLSERHTELKALSDDLMASITRVAEEATFERVRKAVAEGAQVNALAISLARELDELTINLRILVDQANLLSNDALAWLESFALALGEGHQLVYCADDLASERLAAPLASGSALLLTAPDLAFTEDETRAYLSARGSSADVYQVQRNLEGWPAGVGLVAAGVEHVLSHDDLLSAAFDRLPEDVRKALSEASVMEVWREADARRLGCDLPEGWLREARRAGLPMTPLGAQAYRPHTLVVEMLDRELQRQVERYRELHARAGYKARERHDLIKSVQHFQKATKDQEAFKDIEIILPELISRQEFEIAIELLEPFSEENLPFQIASKYGYVLFRFGRINYAEDLSRKIYAEGFHGFYVFFTLSYIAYQRSEFTSMLALIEEALVQANTKNEYMELQRVKAGALAELGHYNEALALSLEFLHWAEAEEPRWRLAFAFSGLEHTYFYMGNYNACEAAIKRALSIYAELKMERAASSLSLMYSMADLYHHQGRLSEALEVLARALSFPESVRHPKRGLMLAVLARVHMSLTNFKKAIEYCQEALPELESLSHTADLIGTYYQLSYAAHREGDVTLAQHSLNKARNRWSGESPGLNGYDDFYVAAFYFLSDNAKAAFEKFETALLLLDDVELEVRTRAFLLELARRKGKLQKGQVDIFIEKLDQCMNSSLLWTDAKPLKLLYQELVARGWFAERFAPFTKPRPANTLQRSRPILLIQTSGNNYFILDGNPFKLPFAKAAELLVWLALHGPATREQIIDALWDGSNDLKHVEYGKLALRRLRTVLAEHVPFNPLVYEGRQYRLADELEVKFDVQDVLRAFEAGDNTARREALERYNGTFLPGVTSEWAEALRIKLHDAAVATAMGLGASYERSDLDLASWAYRKVVELEPLFLDGYRALVQLLQASGDQVGARLAYQTYLRVLTTEYGETPDLSFDNLLHKTQNKNLN